MFHVHDSSIPPWPWGCRVSRSASRRTADEARCLVNPWYAVLADGAPCGAPRAPC
jgi:hypothetical protein